ncbi:MAG: putative beta-agarase [Bacteroidetes bacterium]|nr:putative beta-agarase [Bacteroidota bacterium]
MHFLQATHFLRRVLIFKEVMAVILLRQQIKKLNMEKTITTLLIALSIQALAQSSPVKKTVPDDSLKIILKLKSVNDVLTFNQPHVGPNTLEYNWEIKINTDGKLQTGDSNGYDVGLALVNYKFGSSLSYTGTIISGTDQHTWIYSGGNVTYGNQLNAEFNFADTAIIITGLRSWPELSEINNGNIFMAHTLYNSPNGIETDTLSAAVIANATVVDQTGDVSTSCVDLKSVNIIVTSTVNVSERKKDLNALYIYPNPGNGKFFLSSCFPNNALTKVFNASGAEVCTGNVSGEIDLTNQPAGIYFVKITKDNFLFSAKIILTK